MVTTIYHCDHCEKEVGYLVPVRITARHFDISVHVCFECEKALDDAKYEKGNLYNMHDVCALAFSMVKKILGK